jgi:hypothetical protein
LRRPTHQPARRLDVLLQARSHLLHLEPVELDTKPCQRFSSFDDLRPSLAAPKVFDRDLTNLCPLLEEFTELDPPPRLDAAQSIYLYARTILVDDDLRLIIAFRRTADPPPGKPARAL